jgi:flagellar basal body P-ring protein FlgI
MTALPLSDLLMRRVHLQWFEGVAIVRAVNEVGAAPGDLVAILEALREAGALQAELIVI